MVQMSKMLSGQVALITGGGRGIGRAIAETLAAEGAAVAVTSRSEDQLSAVVAAIEAKGGKAVKVTCDVKDRDSVNRAIAAVEEALGDITFLVNNAGQAGPIAPVGVLDPDEWWDALAVHIRGPMLFMSNIVPKMIQHKGGRILNVCSIGGILISEAFSAYGVGKCAEIRLTEYVDMETKAHGVRAFAIQPGTIITDMAKNTIDDPAAKQYVPWMVDMLKGISEEQSSAEMQLCVQRVAEIAAGQHDEIAGRYVDLQSDLAELKEKIKQEQAASL
jgi:NAD(P)-dependent dehydrogenase (short-subunit alcohol dehydrogenase family)